MIEFYFGTLEFAKGGGVNGKAPLPEVPRDPAFSQKINRDNIKKMKIPSPEKSKSPSKSR